jgi:hypothetical protein
MQLKSQADFLSGLAFAATGATFAVAATAYPIGSGLDMGPGYFPLLLGVLLTVLGSAVMYRSLAVEAVDGAVAVAAAPRRWRPLLFVVLANLVFGLLLAGLPALSLPSLGLVPAIYALTLLASLADGRFRLGQVLLLATLLAVGGDVVLVRVLKLPLHAWPAFVTG